MDNEKLVEWLEKEIAKAKELREQTRSKRRVVAASYYLGRAQALEEVLDAVRRGQRPS